LPVNILIVDDQLINLVLFEGLLKSLGERLVMAHSGEEALELVNREEFAAILLDIRMKGMDGFAAARKIRAIDRCQTTPIIFVTSGTQNEFPISEAYELGAVDYLTKPVEPFILRAKIAWFTELFRKTRSLERRTLQLAKTNAELQTSIALYRDAEESLRATIQRRKEAEQLLQRSNTDLARSNRELEQFAYVASHDLKEPLRKIKVYLQLLERRYQGQLDERADEYIRYAVEGAGNMQALVSDLLAYARTGSQNKSLVPVDSGSAFDDAVSNLEQLILEHGAAVTRGQLPEVLADRGQLVQLFQNLIDNGIKFRRGDRPEIHAESRLQDGDWVFSVRDNGIGIDPRYQDKLFALFQRLHTREEYPGTGIGLAVCKKIVERCGGRIWIDSRLGQGTTFLFTLASIGGDRS
jgi:light-regulated signal transduction histidine kinase (bacteriophytochrome)